jgi:hypothetical protein
MYTSVIGQYIDSRGKTRILNFENVSLIVSPLPPLDVPEMSIQEIRKATLYNALEFIIKHNLKITEKCISESSISRELYDSQDCITGLWLKGDASTAFYYIFVDSCDSLSVQKISDIPISQAANPMLTFEESEFEKVRKSSKIAEYLKQYALIEFSHFPTNFGPRNFSVKPNYDYSLPPESLGSKLSRKNAYFYTGGKIIVPDEDTRDRLILHAKVSAYNDPSIVERYKIKKAIEGPLFYKSVSDFTLQEHDLIFTSGEDVKKWKIQVTPQVYNENEVSQVPLPNSKIPYYYRNSKIEGGRLMIIQNTFDGDFPSALAVSKYWETHRVNVGYRPKDIAVPENSSFNVYTEEGKTHSSSDSDKITMKIFAYIYGDRSYAAVLFL